MTAQRHETVIALRIMIQTLRHDGAALPMGIAIATMTANVRTGGTIRDGLVAEVPIVTGVREIRRAMAGGTGTGRRIGRETFTGDEISRASLSRLWFL